MDLYTKGATTEAVALIEAAESGLSEVFMRIDGIALRNQAKVLDAFREHNIGQRHFAPTTGYGYDDVGRDALDAVFAYGLGAEDALVRPQFASGTHALYAMLSGLLLPGDELLSVTGKPYDTLEQAIGISGRSRQSLAAFGISYAQTELTPEGKIDINAALAALKPNTKVVYAQRSRGYEWRDSLSATELGDAARAIKQARPDVVFAVDNCYGEFTDVAEPVELGADIMAGSLIKNPGGGLAPTGGYIAGKKALIDGVAERLTSPGIGREAGSYAASYAPFFQGFFVAPHVVAQSLKGSALAAAVFERLGYEVCPSSLAPRGDIIQAVKFNEEAALLAFCRSIQAASPVDSQAAPEPWDMPGYQHQVVMAAGAFVQGASIELSADAPIKPPYTAYLQGGLTYEHVKLALCEAASALLRRGA